MPVIKSCRRVHFSFTADSDRLQAHLTTYIELEMLERLIQMLQANRQLRLNATSEVEIKEIDGTIKMLENRKERLQRILDMFLFEYYEWNL